MDVGEEEDSHQYLLDALLRNEELLSMAAAFNGSNVTDATEAPAAPSDVHIFSSGNTANNNRKEHPKYQQLIDEHYPIWLSFGDRNEAKGKFIEEIILPKIGKAYFHDNDGGERLLSKDELMGLIKQKMRDGKRKRSGKSPKKQNKKSLRRDSNHKKDDDEDQDFMTPKKQRSIKTFSIKAKDDADERLVQPVSNTNTTTSMTRNGDELSQIDQEIMALEPPLFRVVTPNRVAQKPTIPIIQGPQALQDLADLMMMPSDQPDGGNNTQNAGRTALQLKPKNQQHRSKQAPSITVPGPACAGPSLALMESLQHVIATTRMAKSVQNNIPLEELLGLAESLCGVYQTQCHIVLALQTVCQEQLELIHRGTVAVAPQQQQESTTMSSTQLDDTLWSPLDF